MIALYIASVCDGLDSRDIYPEQRRKEIESVSNGQLKMQKISSWKLLEKAVKNCFGLAFSNLQFAKNEYGKWECDKLQFSLSHTNEMVAVALSDKPVGVDIESVENFNKRDTKNLAKKIFCTGENAQDNAELLKLWTGKESIYKYKGGGVFSPNKIRVSDYPVKTIEYGGYYISVCGDKDDLSDICIKNLKL